MYYFAAAQEASTTKWPPSFQKFKKTGQDLRVNEAKVTWGVAFTVNFFHSKVKKNPKFTKNSLETAPRFLPSLLPRRPPMPRMCVFPDCFSFSRFFTLALAFTT